MTKQKTIVSTCLRSDFFFFWFNLFGTNNKCVFVCFKNYFLRGMINSWNEVLYLSDLDICGCRLS